MGCIRTSASSRVSVNRAHHFVVSSDRSAPTSTRLAMRELPSESPPRFGRGARTETNSAIRPESVLRRGRISENMLKASNPAITRATKSADRGDSMIRVSSGSRYGSDPESSTGDLV